MISIGFELYTSQVLSVLPGYRFSMYMIRNGKKMASSAGKDVYHLDRLILPNKRMAATGRIHQLSSTTVHPYEPLQTIPCFPIPLLDKQHPIQLVLRVSNEKLASWLKKMSYLYVILQDSTRKVRVPIYLDPQAFEVITSTEIRLNLSTQVEKHFSLFKEE